MPVPPNSIAVGKRYKRLSEVREVVAIDKEGNVTFVCHIPADGGGHATSTLTLPRHRFAREVDEIITA